MAHESVLLKEIIENLDLHENEVVIDATVGNGGHALEIAKSKPNIKIIGIDADPSAIQNTERNFLNAKLKIQLFNAYYDHLDEALKVFKIEQVDKVLFDLGLRTDQLEDASRGFSFNLDGPLKMTFSQSSALNPITAFDVVNDWKEETLADIIYAFGDERFARRIAKAIVMAREENPINTTFELRDIVAKAIPKFMHHKKIHPATKTFQAIRIAVNNELERLETALHKAFYALKTGGRIAVISFHSQEDRVVKNFFKQRAENGEAELINKKIIVPTDEETDKNPKSRSAKLRIIKKI